MMLKKERDDMDRRDDRWAIDKKVPIALVFAIMLQSAGLIWWGARLESRVATLETQRQEQATETNTTKVPERLKALEVQSTFTITTLQELRQDIKEIGMRLK